MQVGHIVPIYESAGTGTADCTLVPAHHSSRLENIRRPWLTPSPAAVRARMSLTSPRSHVESALARRGESLADLQSSRTPAHLRLIFEELLFVELASNFGAGR